MVSRALRQGVGAAGSVTVVRMHRIALVGGLLLGACLSTEDEDRDSGPRRVVPPIDLPSGDVGIRDSGPDAGRIAVSDQEIQAILDASCVRCHNSSAPLSLVAPFRDQVVNVAAQGGPGCSPDEPLLVRPRSHARSYLWIKARGTHSCGELMPPEAPLTAAEIDLIAGWIDAL